MVGIPRPIQQIVRFLSSLWDTEHLLVGQLVNQIMNNKLTTDHCPSTVATSPIWCKTISYQVILYLSKYLYKKISPLFMSPTPHSNRIVLPNLDDDSILCKAEKIEVFLSVCWYFINSKGNIPLICSHKMQPAYF